MGLVQDGLFEFGAPPEPKTGAPPELMSPAQRSRIRELFAQIEVDSAREQFAVVAELTGVQLTSVSALNASAANLLISMLSGRAARSGHKSSGNAWNDREDDTWIDRL